MTRLLAVSLPLCALTFIGCSAGGSGSGGSVPPPVISVAITPNSATIDGTEPINLTAAVSNDNSNAGATWTVTGNNTQGTLSNVTRTSVTYTAPTPASGPLTVNVTATSVADSTKSAVATLSIPAAPQLFEFSGLVTATLGTPVSTQLQGEGGIPPYTWSVVGGSLPPCITLSSAGLLSSASGTPPGVSCLGLFSVNIQLTDSGTPQPLSSTAQNLTIDVQRPPSISFSGNVPSIAVVGQPYTGGSAVASGGAGALTYTVSSGTIPPGLSLNSTTGAITGTPTTVGTFNFIITASDVYADTASQSYQIVVNATNLNAALKGTYACVATGMSLYNTQTTPWGAAFSIVTDGQGNITAGAEDVSDATTDTVNSLTGTYGLTASGNGAAVILETSTTGSPITHSTRTWVLTVPPSASLITHFRMIETDIPQPNYSGANGAARCYLADPTAFIASTLNHSFVFGLHGVNAPNTAYEATAQAEAGRFDAPSASIANGYLEDAIGGGSSPELVTFTGSFSALDPTSGRTVATFTRSYHNSTSTQQLALYFIDSTRALALDVGPWNGEGGKILTGELRLQKQSSWSSASVSGPFVLYAQGSDLTNTNGNFPITGSYSQILHGSADGQGNLALDRSFRNDSGTYTSSANTTSGIALGFDSTNPGRATLLLNSNPISLYFFDNNQAFELSDSTTTVELGRFEAQTQTIADSNTLNGTWIAGQDQPLPEPTDTEGILTLNSFTGTGSLNIVSSTGSSLDRPITPGWSFDTPTPTATFLLNGSLTVNGSSCAILSSTSFVCLPQNDLAPYIFIGQQ